VWRRESCGAVWVGGEIIEGVGVWTGQKLAVQLR